MQQIKQNIISPRASQPARREAAIELSPLVKGGETGGKQLGLRGPAYPCRLRGERARDGGKRKEQWGRARGARAAAITRSAPRRAAGGRRQEAEAEVLGIRGGRGAPELGSALPPQSTAPGPLQDPGVESAGCCWCPGAAASGDAGCTGAAACDAADPNRGGPICSDTFWLPPPAHR